MSKFCDKQGFRQCILKAGQCGAKLWKFSSNFWYVQILIMEKGSF